MPLIEDREIGAFQSIPEADVSKFVEVEAPSVGETFMAGFRQENSFVSAAAKGFGLMELPEPVDGYDPFDGDDIQGYETFAESFIDSKSPAHTARIKMELDQELDDRKTLAASGATGFIAQMAAGITDPITLVTMAAGLGEVRLGATAGQAFRTTAALGALSELPAEAAKQMTQETRTMTESALNIGGAALLSGLLGAGFAKLSAKEVDNLSLKAEQVFNDAPISEKSMGAAQVNQLTMDELDLKGALGLEKIGVSPQVRTMTSPEIETRRIASELMESSLVTKGNVEGISTTLEGGSIETRIKLWDAGLAEGLQSIDSGYLKYRTGSAPTGMTSGLAKSTKTTINDYVLRNRQGKLTPEDFRIEVGKAMRRGDSHEIPEVAETAKVFRGKLFDPLKDAAIDAGLLPKDVSVSTATSYLTRVYQTKKIIAKSDEFDNITRGWLNGIRASALRKFDDAEASGKNISDSLRGEAKITDLEIDEIVVSVRENVTGVASGRLPYDVKLSERGPMKERSFTIPDRLIEDFLESDIDMVARQYKMTMAPDVELAKVYGEVTGTEVVKRINAGYENLRKAATTEKQRENLNKRQAADARDLQAIWDRLRGTYRTPQDPNSFFVRSGRVIRDVNFLRMLGGMTISAIPDLARPIAMNGLAPVGRALKALAFSPQVFKMSKDEARKAAVGLDMVLNSRMASMAEIGDIYARGTKFERGLRSMSDGFGKITLMSQWNTALKQFSGVVTQDRLLTQAVKFADGTISKNNMRRMASAGIDKDMATRIAAQFKKHGDGGSLNLSNGHKWDDRGALETFRSSVLKDVDRTILTPGVGEKPLWTSGETGKMIFQFKTFAAVAHHKIAVADLQNADLQALNGFLISVALGGVAYGAKQYVAGKEISSDPSKIIVESLDKSGAFGYMWDVNNIIEKVSRGSMGVNPMMGNPPMSRYASRNITGALLGPSLGTVEDMIQTLGAATSGEFSQSDIARLIRLLPAQNLFYIRRLLNELVTKAGEGLPE